MSNQKNKLSLDNRGRNKPVVQRFMSVENADNTPAEQLEPASESKPVAASESVVVQADVSAPAEAAESIPVTETVFEDVHAPIGTPAQTQTSSGHDDALIMQGRLQQLTMHFEQKIASMQKTFDDKTHELEEKFHSERFAPHVESTASRNDIKFVPQSSSQFNIDDMIAEAITENDPSSLLDYSKLPPQLDFTKRIPFEFYGVSVVGDEDGIRLKNAIVETVFEEVSAYLKNTAGICKCKKCFFDICAIVLNKLPPRYVTSSEGELFGKLSNISNMPKLSVEIFRAIDLVKGKPGHAE
ncbi:hypothetical protein FACS1894219_09600 [Clostridia bacterium]|nr:hypothetical protein FACS1894219_09600 [Clostridia bacterium]